MKLITGQEYMEYRYCIVASVFHSNYQRIFFLNIQVPHHISLTTLSVGHVIM